MSNTFVIADLRCKDMYGNIYIDADIEDEYGVLPGVEATRECVLPTNSYNYTITCLSNGSWANLDNCTGSIVFTLNKTKLIVNSKY